jgi:hypothetical protein
MQIAEMTKAYIKILRERHGKSRRSLISKRKMIVHECIIMWYRLLINGIAQEQMGNSKEDFIHSHLSVAIASSCLNFSWSAQEVI